MAASLSGVFNLQSFTDGGLPLASGRLYTYTQGTTTHKVAYTDQPGAVPHTYVSDGGGGLYIALDARGELPAPLYLTTGSYDIALKRADGSSVWTRRADPTADSAADVLTRLADAVDATKGAALVAYNDTLRTYTAGSIGARVDSIRLILEKEIDPYELLSATEKNDVSERIGLIDVSAKFQQALDYAGKITPRAGKYNIGSGLIVRGNTCLEGPNNYYFGDNPSPVGVPLVQLLYTPLTGQCIATDAGYPMQVIRNLKITGPGRTVPGRTAPANYGVNVYASTFGLVENVYTELFDVGFYFGRCTNNVFRNNVSSAVNFGFLTQQPLTTHFNTCTILENNYVSDADAYGYNIENTGHGSVFSNNAADLCLGWGMYIGRRTKQLKVMSYYTELCKAGGLYLYQCEGLDLDTIYLAGPPNDTTYPNYRNLRVDSVNDVSMRNVKFEDVGGDYHLETIGTNRWSIDFYVASYATFRASYGGGDVFRFFRQGGKRSLYEGGGLIVKAAAYFYWTGVAIVEAAKIGIASITRSGTGVYVVDLDPDISTAFYMVSVTLDSASITQTGYRIESRTASGFTIKTFSAGVAADPDAVNLMVTEVGTS